MAIDVGVVAVNTATIAINRQGASTARLVQPSGHLPPVADASGSYGDILRELATQLQFSYVPYNRQLFHLYTKRSILLPSG